jgi:hypothetical protein
VVLARAGGMLRVMILAGPRNPCANRAGSERHMRPPSSDKIKKTPPAKFGQNKKTPPAKFGQNKKNAAREVRTK